MRGQVAKTQGRKLRNQPSDKLVESWLMRILTTKPGDTDAAGKPKFGVNPDGLELANSASKKGAAAASKALWIVQKMSERWQLWESK